MSEAAKKSHLKPAEDFSPISDEQFQDMVQDLKQGHKFAEHSAEPVPVKPFSNETRKMFIQNRAHYRQEVDQIRERIRVEQENLADVLETLAFYDRGLAGEIEEDKGAPELIEELVTKAKYDKVD